MQLSLTRISKYENTFSLLNKEVGLIDELELIREGYYKDEILKCRYFVKQGNIIGYKAAKKNLPALTFSGTFSGAHKKENLKNYSQLIVIDIDHIEQDIDSIKRKLINDDYIIAAWLSPSGNGLKALLGISIDYKQHKNAFDQILDYFKNFHNIDIDKTGSDVCRLCYVSYDENLEIKEKFKLFEVLPEQQNLVFIKEKAKSEIVLGYKNRDMISKPYNKRLFLKLLKFLQTRKLSITKTYDDWYRVALAISNSFNPDLGKRYFLELSSLDENYDEYKCLELLDYCYRHKREGAISFRTIIHMAKAHGFKE